MPPRSLRWYPIAVPGPRLLQYGFLRDLSLLRALRVVMGSSFLVRAMAFQLVPKLVPIYIRGRIRTMGESSVQKYYFSIC